MTKKMRLYVFAGTVAVVLSACGWLPPVESVP